MAHNTTLLGVFGFAALGLLGAGCQTTARLQAVTSGYAQCHADDIVITDEHLSAGFGEWDASCGHEQWHCAGAGTVINCRPMKPDLHPVGAPPRQESAPAPSAESKPANPQQSKSNWVTFESDACGASARFPREPRTSSYEVTTASGPVSIETASYERPDGTGAMGLDCAVISKADMSPTRLLDGARNGMISKVKGKLLSEKPVIGGREVRFRVQEREAVARLLLNGDKILIALVVPVDAFPEKSTQRFFDSVRSL